MLASLQPLSHRFLSHYWSSLVYGTAQVSAIQEWFQTEEDQLQNSIR